MCDLDRLFVRPASGASPRRRKSPSSSSSSLGFGAANDETRVISKEQKDSSSRSIIMFGTVNIVLDNANKSVVAKIFFTPSSTQTNNSLLVEALIYKNIISGLIEYHINPHVMAYIGYTVCQVPLRFQSTSWYNDIFMEASRNSRLVSKYYNMDEMHILLTERARGNLLKKHLIEESKIYKKRQHAARPELAQLRWPQDWLPIIFQIVYSIECFVELHVIHNDMHAGNIFVDELASPATYRYFIQSEETKQILEFSVTSKYFIRVYDFDFSTITAPNQFVSRAELPLYNNGKVSNDSDFCNSYGLCSRPDNWYTDLFRIFSSLVNPQNPHIMKWVGQFVDLNLIRSKKLVKWGYLCAKKTKPSATIAYNHGFSSDSDDDDDRAKSCDPVDVSSSAAKAHMNTPNFILSHGFHKHPGSGIKCRQVQLSDLKKKFTNSTMIMENDFVYFAPNVFEKLFVAIT